MGLSTVGGGTEPLHSTVTPLGTPPCWGGGGDGDTAPHGDTDSDTDTACPPPKKEDLDMSPDRGGDAHNTAPPPVRHRLRAWGHREPGAPPRRLSRHLGAPDKALSAPPSLLGGAPRPAAPPHWKARAEPADSLLSKQPKNGN